MKNKYRYIIALALTAITLSASAQRGTLNNAPAKQDAPVVVSNVIGKSTVNSNLKSRGFVGPYEIVAHRERGLFGPSTVETYIFDTRTGTLAVINPSSSPGVGIAAVNGGALVGASYVFGKNLRPDQTNVSNGSNSSASAEGGNASSSATGGMSGAGGDASSNSNATGGNGNGGAGGSGGSGGSGGWVPPGHQNPKPGNGPKK